MTDQERAKEEAVRELTSWLGPVTNLRDPEAGARKFMDWLESRYWRCWPPPPGITAGEKNPEAYERGAAQARDLLKIRKDDHE